jgi:tetratricopeptide (TPR) repeat protein
MRRAFPAVALLVAAVLPPSAAAQSAQEQLQYGIEAYGNLELGAAVAFIRRALAASPEEGLSEAERATALGYLGAAEHYRGRSDSAIAAFRQMVLLNPRYRPDPLVFPPPVVRVYDGVRRSLKVIGTAAPPDTTIRLHEEETFAVQLYASSYHSISSLVELARQDSLTYPPPPADSLLLPERRSAGPGLKSLGLGLALGALAAGLPQLVGGSEEASNSRYAVGGAIAIGGIIGLVMRPPGAALPDNIAANEVLMYEWQARRDSVFAENVQRLRDVRLHIRTGAPLRIEHEGS